MSAALVLRTAWGIRSYLAILVLAVALPAGGLIAYGIYDAGREATAQANARVRAIADEIAGEIAFVVRGSEALLGRIASRPLVRALDPKRCDPAIREFVDLNPQYVTLAVRDSLGNPVCAYHPDPYGAERVAAFPWFQEGLRSGGFSISGAFFRPRPGRVEHGITPPG